MSRAECRLCVEENGVIGLDEELRLRISQCFNITTSPLDGLPQLICFKCKLFVNEFYSAMLKYQDKQAELCRKYEIAVNTIITLKSVEKMSKTVEPVTKTIEHSKITNNVTKVRDYGKENVSNSSNNLRAAKVVPKIVAVSGGSLLGNENNMISRTSIPKDVMTLIPSTVNPPLTTVIKTEEIIELELEDSSSKYPEVKIEEVIIEDDFQNNELIVPPAIATNNIAQNMLKRTSESVTNFEQPPPKMPRSTKTIVSDQDGYSDSSQNSEQKKINVCLIRYNCKFCYKTFFNKKQILQHQEVSHQNMILHYDKLIKPCMVSVKKLDFKLENKMPYSLTPDWVYINRDTIRKIDLDIKYCFLSKLHYSRALPSKTVKSNSGSDSDDLTLKSISTQKPSHNVYKEDTSNNVSKLYNALSNKESSNIATKHDSEHSNDSKISLQDKKQIVITREEVGEMAIKCYNKYSECKTDLRTKFLDKIKKSSIDVVWTHAQNSCKPFFFKNKTLQKHSVKSNGLCLNMMGLKPLINTPKNRIPISQTLLNIKYCKLSDADKEKIRRGTSVESLLASKEENSQNEMMPKIISTFSLPVAETNNDFITPDLPGMSTSHKPLIKCKPTSSLLMPSMSNFNATVALPVVLPKETGKNKIQPQNYQDSYGKNVILNFHLDSKKPQNSSTSQALTSDSVYGTNVVSNQETSLCLNNQVPAKPYIIMDSNFNTGNNLNSNIAISTSASSNNTFSSVSTSANDSNLREQVDFENSIASPVVFKPINFGRNDNHGENTVLPNSGPESTMTVNQPPNVNMTPIIVTGSNCDFITRSNLILPPFTSNMADIPTTATHYPSVSGNNSSCFSITDLPNATNYASVSGNNGNCIPNLIPVFDNMNNLGSHNVTASCNNGNKKTVIVSPVGPGNEIPTELDTNRPFFRLQTELKSKGVDLYFKNNYPNEAVRHLVKFKIVINETYKNVVENRTYHVKLSLLRDGSFLLNLTNAEQQPENIYEWSYQYQRQLIQAFRKESVLQTLSIMATSNSFNCPPKTEKFLSIVSNFEI